jgi:ABC-type nickel/cobalt efflux system permease component RcnA
MEARDRTANLGFFAAAAVVWILVALVVTTRDPLVDRSAGFVGAFLIGLAITLTLVPFAWLVVFARHRRIAYRGDWLRAIRRSAWVGITVAVLVILRLQGLLELPIALFMIALVLVAEATLSAER